MSNDDPFHAPSPEDLAVLLTQYDVEFFIAKGGMGAVYKGRQRSLDRDIAIKVLPKELGENEEFRESFISEAKAMARLNHSNLLGVFDYGTVDGMPYIVMEYVSGGSLHQAAYNQAAELEQAATIIKGICSGLAHAHEHGIVHRDIKPSNILLTKKMEPKVADFGLAHHADSDKPGLMMGTPGYTAPEVFQDPNLAGPLADIYSVGVILHQLLTGIDPAGSMEPPTVLSGSLRLDAIWRKATHVNPALRYQTITAMEADLDKWIAAKHKAAPAPPPSLHPPKIPTSTGGKSMGKLVAAGVLLVLIFVAHNVLKTKEAEAAKTIAEIEVAKAKENEVAKAIAEVEAAKARIKPVPTPVPDVTPEPIYEPEQDGSLSVKHNPDSIGVLKPESEVAKNNQEEKQKPVSPENAEPGDPELIKRAIGLVGDARKKRDKELASNVSTLHFNLKSVSSGAQQFIVDGLKGDIEDSRIPDVSEVRGIPDKIKNAFKESLSREQPIDSKYRNNLTIIRDAYATRLKSSAADTSDKDLKMRLLAQSEKAENLDEWIALLAPESKRVALISSFKMPGWEDGGLVGKWDVESDGDVVRWIGHPDGRVEVVYNPNRELSWEILQDGTLEIKGDAGRKPYKLRLEDGVWRGSDSFGNFFSIRRGEW